MKFDFIERFKKGTVMMKKKVRNNLIYLRQEKGYTQIEVALKVGISLRQYQALEAGTSDGSIKVWKRLKKLLNAKSIDYLLAETNIPFQDSIKED